MTITNAVSVQVPEPCSQNWNNMENRGNQRFCESCNKCVIDFSGYSNAEIISTLANSTTDVCGRLSQSQLYQLNYHMVVTPPSKNWMKYVGVLAIGASFFVNTARAIVPAKTILQTVQLDKDTPKKNSTTVKRIYGYVLDENKKPLAGVKLTVANTKISSLTDKNGRFDLNFDKNFNYK